MSSLFRTQNFEERLELAFRGDAGEQRKSRKEFQRARRRLQMTQPGLFGVSTKATLGRSNINIFKSNLGGTNRAVR
jgi:hypothetical protein